MTKRNFMLSSCLCLLTLWNQVSAAEIVVIGHPSAPIIDRNQALQIFLSKTHQYTNGQPARPLSLPNDDELNLEFYRRLSNKTGVQLRAYWSRLVFTGSGELPEKVDDSVDMIDLVAEDPSLVGYVFRDDVTDDVKVLLSLPE